MGIGCLVSAEYDVKVWYYDRTDAERRSVRVVTDSETDRLFAFNLHVMLVSKDGELPHETRILIYSQFSPPWLVTKTWIRMSMFSHRK